MKLLNETLLCWAIISLVLIFLLQTGGKLVPFFRVYVDGKYVFQGTLVWMIKIVKTFFGCSHLTLEHSAHRKIDLSFLLGSCIAIENWAKYTPSVSTLSMEHKKLPQNSCLYSHNLSCWKIITCFLIAGLFLLTIKLILILIFLTRYLFTL